MLMLEVHASESLTAGLDRERSWQKGKIGQNNLPLPLSFLLSTCRDRERR